MSPTLGEVGSRSISWSALATTLFTLAFLSRPMRKRWSTSMHCAGVCGAGSSSTSSRKPAIVRTSIRRPTMRVRGDPAEDERNTWTQSHADQRCRRCESSLFRPHQRTAQRPLGRPALQFNRDCRAAVRHDSDCCVTFGRDHPETPDVGTQHIGRLVESNLCAMDDSAGDAHFGSCWTAHIVNPSTGVTSRRYPVRLDPW